MPHLSRGLDVFACFLIKSVVWQRGNQVPQVRVERQFQRMKKQPEVLRELFEALSNDPFVIAECLARPVLAERMATGLHVTQTKTGLSRPTLIAEATANYTLPTISDGVTLTIPGRPRAPPTRLP